MVCFILNIIPSEEKRKTEIGNEIILPVAKEADASYCLSKSMRQSKPPKAVGNMRVNIKGTPTFAFSNLGFVRSQFT